MNHLKRTVFAIATLLFLSNALAHRQIGADRVDYRQGAYRIMGWHMGILGAMSRGDEAFDLERARESIRHLAWAERLTSTTFTADTKNVSDTRLLPKAWDHMDAFVDRGRALKQAIDLLVRDADAGDEARMKAAIGDVGKACKACHDDFRQKMHH